MKEGWAFSALALLGDDETARRLTVLIREWPSEGVFARAAKGLDVLAGMASDAALMHLHGIAAKVKSRPLQERAREKLILVAEARGLTAEELGDLLVPDLGLDEAGALELSFGPRTFTLRFDESLKPFVKDSQGVRLKDLPKPVKSDDAALAETATQRYKRIKKEARAIAALQVLRMEQAMVAQRRWPAVNFRRFIVEHPVMRHLAARLVWGVFADGRLTDAFRISEDLTLADASDRRYELGADAIVGIPHVLGFSKPTLDAFGQIFADYEILQPFKQLGREAYALTDAEKQSHELKRFQGRTYVTASVMGLAKRGWEAQSYSGGMLNAYAKSLGEDLRVTVDLDPGTIIGDPTHEPRQKIPNVTLSRRTGYDSVNPPHFRALDAIAASEVLRDIELLVLAKE
jgi:hypothetical protein